MSRAVEVDCPNVAAHYLNTIRQPHTRHPEFFKIKEKQCALDSPGKALVSVHVCHDNVIFIQNIQKL